MSVASQSLAVLSIELTTLLYMDEHSPGMDIDFHPSKQSDNRERNLEEPEADADSELEPTNTRNLSIIEQTS